MSIKTIEAQKGILESAEGQAYIHSKACLEEVYEDLEERLHHLL